MTLYVEETMLREDEFFNYREVVSLDNVVTMLYREVAYHRVVSLDRLVT